MRAANNVSACHLQDYRDDGVVESCRNKYGEYFGITVAGYPEAHPDAIVSDPAEMDKIYWNDLHYLKEKVRAHTACVL